MLNGIFEPTGARAVSDDAQWSDSCKLTVVNPISSFEAHAAEDNAEDVNMPASFAFETPPTGSRMTISLHLVFGNACQMLVCSIPYRIAP